MSPGDIVIFEFCQCEACCEEAEIEDDLDAPEEVETWCCKGEGERGIWYENVDDPVLMDEGEVGARW